jgi:hypothetical protein
MAEERPQSVEEWRAMLSGAAEALPARAPLEPAAAARNPPAAKHPPPLRGWLRALAYAAGVIAIAVVAIGLYELVRSWRG